MCILSDKVFFLVLGNAQLTCRKTNNMHETKASVLKNDKLLANGSLVFMSVV